MKTVCKIIKINKLSKSCPKVGIETASNSQPSQLETVPYYKVELSLEEYAQLARRALREGCTPEELVARSIEHLAR